MNYLEGKTDRLEDQLTRTEARVLQAVDNSITAATANYNLYVYLPKSYALSSYEGQEIYLSSPTGNQKSTIGTLKDSGDNWATTLYFNFSGVCKLYFNYRLADGSNYGTNVDVSISDSGQEFKLPNMTGNVSGMPYSTVACILRAGLAGRYGITIGTRLTGNWFVVGSSGNSLKLWRPASAGSGTWSQCNSAASTYFNTFNSAYGVLNVAYSSSILNKNEICTGWFVQSGSGAGGGYNNDAGVDYWTSSYSDWYIDGGKMWYYLYYVKPGGSSGYLEWAHETNSFSYAPAVWIH